MDYMFVQQPKPPTEEHCLYSLHHNPLGIATKWLIFSDNMFRRARHILFPNTRNKKVAHKVHHVRIQIFNFSSSKMIRANVSIYELYSRKQQEVDF